MVLFIILFIVSINFVIIGYKTMSDCFEDFDTDTWRTIASFGKESVVFLLGAILGILGTILYAILCVHVVTDFFGKGHYSGLEIYGVSMILTSLIMGGGFASCISVVDEDKEIVGKIAISVSIVALIAYLILKFSSVLP